MTIKSIEDIEALEARGFQSAYPERTPWEILSGGAKRHPDATAIRYLRNSGDPSSDEIITYGELAQRIKAAARLFRELAITPDKSVAILTQHTPSAQIALWGAQIVGAACPINPMLKPAHIAALLKAANVGAMVVTGVNEEIDYWSSLVPELRKLGVSMPILSCDADQPSNGSDGDFETLIAARTDGPDIEAHGDENSVAAFYHTGGTTGEPKLVVHSRLNEAHVGRSCALLHDLGAKDVVVNGFPLFHVAGAFVYGLSTLSAGGTIVIPGRLGMRNQSFVKSIWKQVERLKITVIGAVPTILSTLNGIPIDADISSLKWLLTGGSPLPTELADASERITGKSVRNILGMTESAGAIAVEPVYGPRTPLSCGLRMPFSEVAIFGEIDGQIDITNKLPHGETGIIGVRGPNVSSGYSDKARNAGTFLPDGWLISGDLGRLDDKGRLYVTGRKKDVIIRGAHNIDPQMIEDALLSHPDVENAAAIGMPDSYAGELPVAFVTLRQGVRLEGETLIAFLKDKIDDPVALPKRISIIDAMPQTPVGKIFKPTLRRQAIEWAIRSAADSLSLDDITIEIEENSKTLVRVQDAQVDKMKQALAGMPLEIKVVSGVTI